MIVFFVFVFGVAILRGNIKFTANDGFYRGFWMRFGKIDTGCVELHGSEEISVVGESNGALVKGCCFLDHGRNLGNAIEETVVRMNMEMHEIDRFISHESPPVPLSALRSRAIAILGDTPEVLFSWDLSYDKVGKNARKRDSSRVLAGEACRFLFQCCGDGKMMA